MEGYGIKADVDIYSACPACCGGTAGGGGGRRRRSDHHAV